MLTGSTVKNQYTGNGSTATYSFTFYTFAQADLAVSVVSTGGTIYTLTLTTDYTVTGAGNISGGSITLVSSGQAWLTGGNLTTGYGITIKRVRSVTQTTDLRNQTSFFAENHEDALDHEAMLAQQINEIAARSLQIPVTDTSGLTVTLPTAALRANSFLSFDGSGNTTVTGINSISGTTLTTGTWAPTLVGTTTPGTTTYGVQLGKYAKLGSIVFVAGSIVTSSITGGSGNAKLSGLPFASSNTGLFFNSLYIGYANGITYTSTGTSLGALINTLSTDAPLYSLKSGSITNVAYTDLASATTIYFSGVYFT